ncbi:MAG: hypothetical protein ACO1SX_05450, partial [Actinomycetota bacterium]
MGRARSEHGRLNRLGSVMLALLLLSATPALAHQGPPYPIIVDRAVGPYTFTVWADPDVGTATFYMNVEGAAPDVIELWVQPDDR